jgi:DNA-binding NarL/FixJ family response regulator
MIPFSIIRYISKKISVITRQERRRSVLELYNHGKTKHEIAKEASISFDI